MDDDEHVIYEPPKFGELTYTLFACFMGLVATAWGTPWLFFVLVGPCP